MQNPKLSRRRILQMGATGALLASPPALRLAMAQSSPAYPKEIRLDWGYYSPQTLLIKNRNGLVDAFKDVGTKITWAQSYGSNNSLEYLKTGATDFAGSAGLSAFLSRANGVPLKVIYVASWSGSSLVQVLPNSPIKSLPDLKGKKIAVTLGTAPYFTLIRGLAQYKLTLNDLKVINLQHPEGFAALQQGQVDAWVGIDPQTAQAQLAGDRTIFSRPDWRDGSVFSVSEDFLHKYPQAVDRVLKVWAQSEQWIRTHNKEFVDFVTQQTGGDPKVNELTINRRDWNNPVPGKELLDSIRAVAPLLGPNVLYPGVNVEKVLGELLDPAPAKRVLNV